MQYNQFVSQGGSSKACILFSAVAYVPIRHSEFNNDWQILSGICMQILRGAITLRYIAVRSISSPCPSFDADNCVTLSPRYLKRKRTLPCKRWIGPILGMMYQEARWSQHPNDTISNWSEAELVISGLCYIGSKLTLVGWTHTETSYYSQSRTLNF